MVRLARFFGLVKNEYIKILKKLSTKILLGLIVISAFGLSLIALVAEKTSQAEMEYFSDDYSAVDEYEEQISWLEQTKPEGYEIQIKAYQALIDCDAGYEDWRCAAAEEISELDAAQASELLIYIKTNDWRGYCSLKIRTASSESEKWGYQYRLDHGIDMSEKFDKQNALIDKIDEAKMGLEYAGSEESAEKSAYEDTVTLGMYQLENEIYENTADMTNIMNMDLRNGVRFFNVFMQTPMLVTVISMIMIIIAGGSVALEFHQGTIKFLLINPVKRWKILMSKYFTVITMGYILTVLLFVLCIPAVGIIHGFAGINDPYLYVADGEVQSMNSFLYAVRAFAIASVETVVMATFAFAISSLIRSSALAVGAGVFMMFAGNTIVMVLSQLGVDWARYFLFANTDLLAISQGNSMFPQHTVGFAVAVLIAHMAVFILTAWDGFTKKSV